jgi:hypothetical protein
VKARKLNSYSQPVERVQDFFMPKLLPNQLEAIAFFKHHKYLVVEAPRSSGKTFLLQELVRQNPTKQFGVRCLSYPFFRQYYEQFENCTYIERDIHSKKFDILLGDEILIEPSDTPSACALTKRYIVLRWKTFDNPYIDKEDIEEARKVLAKDAYRMEFGQYE